MDAHKHTSPFMLYFTKPTFGTYLFQPKRRKEDDPEESSASISKKDVYTHLAPFFAPTEFSTSIKYSHTHTYTPFIFRVEHRRGPLRGVLYFIFSTLTATVCMLKLILAWSFLVPWYSDDESVEVGRCSLINYTRAGWAPKLCWLIPGLHCRRKEVLEKFFFLQ